MVTFNMALQSSSVPWALVTTASYSALGRSHNVKCNWNLPPQPSLRLRVFLENKFFSRIDHRIDYKIDYRIDYILDFINT